jgi:hypothetical protein
LQRNNNNYYYYCSSIKLCFDGSSRTSLAGLSAFLRNAIFIFALMSSVGSILGRRHRFRVRSRSPLRPVLCYGTMARHSLKLTGSPLYYRAFFNAQPHVISGHPFGLECATQPVSNCRGARVIGIRATWPAQ